LIIIIKLDDSINETIKVTPNRPRTAESAAPFVALLLAAGYLRVMFLNVITEKINLALFMKKV